MPKPYNVVELIQLEMHSFKILIHGEVIALFVVYSVLAYIGKF